MTPRSDCLWRVLKQLESVGTGPCGGEVFGQILARMSGMLDLSSEVPPPEAFAVGIAGRITGDKT